MIGVIGLGFVGLTSALGFADYGVPTLGYDISQSRLMEIGSVRVPFYEPGLEEALRRNLNKNFHIADSMIQIVNSCDIIFLCVGTPQDQNGRADLSQVKSALNEIIENNETSKRKVILIKSTVPPSTTDIIQNYVDEKFGKRSLNITIGVNPEFLREGHAWDDFVHPDRIVVGINSEDYSRNAVLEIYRKFNSQIVFTTTSTAEFLKYLSNTLLSTLISFSNEMSIIAKNIGDIDIQEAFKLLHLDRRFNGTPAPIVSYIYPGCGYGGYCLPKDTMAIARLSEDFGFRPNMLEANIEINRSIMTLLLGDFLDRHFDKSVRIGVLGLSFKPDSDDVRETSAFQCVKLLHSNGYVNIMAYDPMANKAFQEKYPELGIEYYDNINSLIEKVEIIFIVTAWREFTKADFSKKIVFDLRYMINNSRALEKSHAKSN
jgi:UDPglucose 6-dehydrogenase